MTTKIPSEIVRIDLTDASYKDAHTYIEPTYVNFFFGNNGTGKSTIARAIKSGAGISYASGRTSADYLPLVYDQEFIDENFRSYRNMKGVFTLNARNAAIQQQIEEKTEDGETFFVVNSTMTYECDNTEKQFAASGDKIVKTYSGFCNNQRYSDIDSLLVLYAPFSGVDTLNLETVNIEKNTLKDMDVYIIVQSDGGESFSGPALKVNVDTAATGSIKLYSQASLDVTPATIASEKKIIHDVADSDDTIYNIDVEVYESGGTFSRRITSIQSTLVNR